MNVASELRRFETRVANHTPCKFIFGVIIHKIMVESNFSLNFGKAGDIRALMPQSSFLLMQDE
ncbi:hypothetical protein DMH88_06480 [Escherichia coli]|nr:hypothetical protein [Escherichia coli]